MLRSFSFPSQISLTNVATSLANAVFSDPPATVNDEGLPKKEGGRCMNCTFAHANLKIVATQLTATGTQQKTEAETNSAVHSVSVLG